MALEGTIKDFGLADIFQLIGLQKKTGTLFLKGLETTVNIHFEDGAVVKAEESLKIPKYLTGRILINLGKIEPYQLEEALEVQKTTARKIGSILIGQELINKDDLQEALSFQMKEAVYRVFRWKGGDYKFYQDKVEYDRDTVAPFKLRTSPDGRSKDAGRVAKVGKDASSFGYRAGERRSENGFRRRDGRGRGYFYVR